MSIARRLLSIEAGQVRPFKFTIQTTSAVTQFELPINVTGAPNPNITVDWGDADPTTTITTKNSSNRFHTYASAGTYQIIVNGYCPAFKVNNSTYRTLYRSVDDWGQVGFTQIDFYGCINLTSLPNDGSSPNPNATLHEGLNTVINFDSTFRQTGIGPIPVGLFDYASNAKTFINTFVFCQSITQIPSGLFDNNTLVTAFSGTFNACVNLTSIPSNLFDNNTLVVNFESVFRNCRKIAGIPSQLFTNNQSVTTFANAFNMATTSNLLTGVTPTDSNGDEIWERTPTPTGTDCFAFCTGLTNFASIPPTFT
jgi:hypothetical protein